jgi:hypothetical protein
MTASGGGRSSSARSGSPATLRARDPSFSAWTTLDRGDHMSQLTLRTDDLYWREVDDEIVVLEGRGSTYLSVNHSGVLLWRLLARGATRDELIAALVEVYGIDAEAAAADADRFIDGMRSAALLAA